jgi:uncharacterized protein YkwD
VHQPTPRQRQNRLGRHRVRVLPTSLTLGISVTALLGLLGVGVALLPASLTGPGLTGPEMTGPGRPAAAIASLAPGVGGGTPAGHPTARPADLVTPPTGATSNPPVRTSPAPRRTTATPAPGGRTAEPAPGGRTAQPAPSAKKATGLAAQEEEVVRLVDKERRKAGCATVRVDKRLRTAIRLHVAELGRHGDLYISHVSDDGRTFVQRAEEQGYHDAGGENVARGQRDADDVMQSWMNSEGHRANILNCSFKAIGVGAVRGVDGTLVWGQIFGRS